MTDYEKALAGYNAWVEETKKIPKLEEESRGLTFGLIAMYEMLKQLDLCKVLHEDYLPYVKTILGYFEHGRVNNQQEAVNLLENELREARRGRDSRKFRNEMVRQARIQAAAAEDAAEYSRQAAASADEAAFWGAAATFVAAANKNKSDSNDYRVV